MTSSDPKAKCSTDGDEGDGDGDGDEDEEVEYEEIEVEEEVEEVVEVEEEEQDEEEEEEEEFEEVEEEEEGFEEVEEEIEEEVEEEVEEEIEEVVEEIDEDDEEMAARPAIEEERAGVNHASLHMDCKGDEVHSRLSIVVESDTNVSCDIHSVEATKHDCKSSSCDEKSRKGNGGEMHVTLGCPITTKLEGNVPKIIHASETIRLDDKSLSLDEQNRKGKGTLFVDNGTPKIPELLEHVVGSHSHSIGNFKDEHGYVEKSISVDASDERCCALDGSDAQMGENKANNIEVTTTTLLKSNSGEQLNLHFQSMEDVDLMASRSAPQVRPRSPSPRTGYEDGNKRPTIVCEYFAKGWCIKGSSCRFLHVRDHVDDHSEKLEGNISASKSSGDVVDGSKLPVHFQSDVTMGISDDPLNNTELEHVEGLQLHPKHKDKTTLFEKGVSSSRLSASSQESPSFKDKSHSIVLAKEVEGDFFKENHSFDRYNDLESSLARGGSVQHGGLFSKYGSLSKGVGMLSGSYSNYRLPPYSGIGESAAMRRHYSLDGYSSPRYGSSVNISSKYKTKFTPYDWEPSVPFRPSFIIPSMSRTPSDAQYDPLRDSIEQPGIGHLSFHNPSNRRGSIFEDVQSISGWNSLESNKNLHHDIWDKSYYGHKKDVALVEVEYAETSTSDVQNKNILEEENPVVLSSVKDMLKANTSGADVAFKLLSDEMGADKEIGEKGRKSGHLDEEESKAIKYFRAALIEFVKELMKPVWHEGRLSKDVYKVIVQKAEDKILSTLPSDKVPNTSESIKQYLSSSRPKILKLIQAYVDKYGKF